jgi:hypothetical protein
VKKLHHRNQNSKKNVPPPGKTKAHPPGITKPSLFAYYVLLMLALVTASRLHKNSPANHEELHKTLSKLSYTCITGVSKIIQQAAGLFLPNKSVA